MKNEKVDVLVIGAGPAGTVAASIVNKYGLKVKIVEKQKFPRFVIGESLLPKSMEAFEDAGFIDGLTKKGFQQKSGAKFVQGNTICDFNFSDQYTSGWSWTWQAPRAELDHTLAEEVQRMGVPINFETDVTNIEFNGSDSVTTVKDRNGESRKIEARFIIDSSGYGRVIPKLFKLDRPSNLPPRKTMFTHIEDIRRMDYDEPNRITIIDHKPEVWVWVIPFSNGNSSLGFVGNPEFFDAFDGTPEQKLRAMIASDNHLRERFDGCRFIFDPRSIEGWSMSTDKFYGDGFVLTGNVTEFLDPIFSSGVTLAVTSSQKAAHLTGRQLTGKTVDWEKEYTEFIMQGVNTFRSYVIAWYDGTLQDIFFAPNPNDTIKNQICSVLAGYVWDTTNPFVKKHNTAIKALSNVIKQQRVN
jgi:flavin-dependent dehydrogenase